jgi:nitrate/TMAO reductase-like tetraheme cytochrome c subunit
LRVSSKAVGTGLYRNAVSYFGALIVVFSSALILLALIAGFTLSSPGPYLGIFTYLVFPGFLGSGVVLILGGMRWEAGRRRKRNTDKALPYPILDLNDSASRKRFGYVLVIGSLVGILMALTGYNGFLFTESITFCGKTCHTVMQPEHTAYMNSPHARVRCVECHVGEGADWYVKSKLSGARQVIAVVFKTYKRPIPVPIHDLRPARETCEHCHWPQKFYGAKLLQMPHYRYDETNTAEQVTLTLRTGGGSKALGSNSGIHFHMIIDNKVSFAASDEHLQQIPWVSVKHSDGSVVEYTAPEYAPDKATSLRKRDMDCMDCHNRPSHGYPPPDSAVDIALYSGLISPTIPWIKKVSVETLVRPFTDNAMARDQIRAGVTDFYKQSYPAVAQSRAADIQKAVEVLTAIWERSVFPAMNVDWKTYPDNIGHRNWPGCFRCHDGRHKSKEGKLLTMDCTTCHTMPQRGPLLGLGNVSPNTTMEWHPWDLGKHLSIEPHKTVLCNACHQAGYLPRKECKDCHK